jgi:uncharacterized metal-binding protein
MLENETTPANPKPIIYSCSGCSDAGELADRVARELNKRGVGEMSCLAGVGGRVKPLLSKAQRAQEIVVIDGCPLNCARHTLLNAGVTNFQHVALQTLGQRKGSCPVTTERVESVTTMVVNVLKSKKTPAAT